MAQSGFSAFLLFLVVSYVNGNDTTNLCENILNASLNNAILSDFNLTVSPAHLLSNTIYTVNVTGNGNFTVLLQAVTPATTPVGNWSQGANQSCNGSSLFINYFTSSKLLQTTWTSPGVVTTVTIKAFIHNDTSTFLLQQLLSQDTNVTTQAPATANSTQNSTISSAAPATANSTQNSTISSAAPATSNSTQNSTMSSAAPATANSTHNSTISSAVTTHRVDQTTSAGSIDQSSLISVALSMVLSLLLIPNKHLA